MNAKSRKTKTYEMNKTWESYRWLLKERLLSMDNISRSMVRDMQTLGVPSAMIAEQLPQLFVQLKEEVVQENERSASA